MSVCKQTVWVLPLGWPLTLLWPLRSGEWDHITLCLALCVGISSLAKLVCVIVVPVGEHVCDGGGGQGRAVCLFLVARETPSACVCCYTCQTMALLLSIQRERGQGGASHHLPTKGQVTQPASAPPHFLPSPLSSPHPTAEPAEKTEGFSLFFCPLIFFVGSPI